MQESSQGKGGASLALSLQALGCLPVDLPSIERLRVENHRRRVPGLGAVDADFSSELHPWDGENGTCVGTGQGEHVLLPKVQEPQHTSRGEKRQELGTQTWEKGGWGSI